MDNLIDLKSAKAESETRALDTLARTLWGEARGEGQAGMKAVANVIINRVAHARAQPGGDYWWGNTMARVCLKPKQFSCWNAGDPNLPKLRAVTLDDAAFANAMRIAQWAASGTLPDSTGGATHYHTVNILPAWAVGRAPTTIIGRQVFYRIVS